MIPLRLLRQIREWGFSMLGIIDVGEWQSVIDLETAKPVARDKKCLEPLRRLAEKYPYPGDRNMAGIEWVTSAAADVVEHYRPGWLFLGFTQLYFNSMYSLCPTEKRKEIAGAILNNIMGFAREYNFSSLILGSGGLVPLKGYRSISGLKGYLQSSPWSHNLAGIYRSEPGDEEILAREPHISAIIRKSDFVVKYSGASPSFISDFPDYLLISEEGWNFKGICSNNRDLYHIEKYNSTLPLYSEIGTVSHVEGICPLMVQALARGEKVLLALVEGLDGADFFLPHQDVANCCDWYAYSSYSLYWTLVTGKPFYLCPYPPIFDMSTRRALPLRYPASTPHAGIICEDSLGRRAGVPTAAVSSRSMTTHSMVNADLMVECYMRNQANMGVLVAVNEDRYNVFLEESKKFEGG